MGGGRSPRGPSAAGERAAASGGEEDAFGSRRRSGRREVGLLLARVLGLASGPPPPPRCLASGLSAGGRGRSASGKPWGRVLPEAASRAGLDTCLW